MTCLLAGLSRDSDHRIRLLYAQWLGAIGAIDPSRLIFTICANESIPSDSIQTALNWNHLFPFDVLMELAKIYMRAASPKQLDSAALAIQELLRLFAVPGAQPTVAKANLPDTSRFIAGAALWDKFAQSVQDLFTPLLNSRYVVEAFTDWNSITTPIISQGNCQSYESWIRLWSGSLKVYVSESATFRLFQVCEPVVKSDVEFARYLLNPVALQVVIEGSQMGILKLRAEILGVLEAVAHAEQPSGQDTGSPAEFLINESANHPVSSTLGSDRKHWMPWYPLAAQTVFSLLDYLSGWHRVRSASFSAVVAAVAKAASSRSGDGFKPNEDEKSRLTDLNLAVTRVAEFLACLPHTVLAKASLRISALARALRHWESAFAEDDVAAKTLYVSGFVDRLGVTTTQGGPLIGPTGRESLVGLLETFTALHDTDGLCGVLALMQQTDINATNAAFALTATNNDGRPDTFRRSMLQALQLENEDQLDMACATYEHALTTIEGSARGRQLGLHAGLFRCQLPDPGRLQSLVARTDALLSRQLSDTPKTAAWTRQLNEYRTEAAIRLADWGKLDEFIASNSSESSWPVGLGKVFLATKHKQTEAKHCQQPRNFIAQLRLSQMANLSTAALEGSRGYLQACGPLEKLSLLTEVEALIALSDQLSEEVQAVDRLGLLACQKNSDLLVKNMLSWLEARLQQSQSTLHTLEPVLAVRHSTLQLISAGLREAVSVSTSSVLPRYQASLLDAALADSWLQRAKLARRAGQFMAAYTCVLNAERYGSQGALTERAKLLLVTGKREAAFTCLDEGLQRLSSAFSCENPAQSLAMPPPPPPIATVKTADCGNTESPLRLHGVQQALLLRARICEETSRFDFDTTRRLYSEICDAYSGCEEAHFRLAHYVDEARNQSGKQHDLLLKVALEHYGKALAFGSQFIYQSMPRFLTLWLDYGGEVAKRQQQQQQQQQSSVASSHRTTGQKSSVAEESTSTFDEVQHVMRLSLQKIPPYQFYTALGQILSRVCHEHPDIIAMLIDLIARIFVAYPQQTIWFLMSLHDSTVTQRRERCQQIFATVRRCQKSLNQFISDCVAFCAQLRSICGLFVTSERRDLRSFSISQAARTLTRLLETSDLSRVLIPIHRQLVPTLLRPRASQQEVQGHLPFGPSDRFICLARLEDNVEILGSQTRPKKMHWLGSDGRRYVIVAKPNDDLRKDSRLMDMNGMINKFLLKNPQTRHRVLQIRTYAVIPLSEQGGLIEWAYNTQPFRAILTRLYIDAGRPFNWANMNRHAPLLEDALEVKREKFLKKWLPMYPLVFYRWFLHGFPNPCAWYEARETFARTCAVMSMVGYVLGLGDRHTENILFDCTTGGLVHVDFSCVFNTGLTLPWPERVPFRLTRNLVHAMGPTGYEGTFRRSAEVTMRLLRREIDPLMAVFRAIYFDALVEQGGVSRASDDVARRARRSVFEASTVDDKITRAAMEKLADMEDRLRGKITEHDDFGKLLPMSVEGQVDTLIKEATSVDRLCQMYKGWMPFL